MKIKQLIAELERMNPDGDIYTVFNGAALDFNYSFDDLEETVDSGADEPVIVFVNNPKDPESRDSAGFTPVPIDRGLGIGLLAAVRTVEPRAFLTTREDEADWVHLPADLSTEKFLKIIRAITPTS